VYTSMWDGFLLITSSVMSCFSGIKSGKPFNEDEYYTSCVIRRCSCETQEPPNTADKPEHITQSARTSGPYDVASKCNPIGQDL
jgi:hypothetical protein